MLKVKVDRELCVGAANCVAYAPTVFQLDGERKPVVLDPASVEDDTLMTAAESCPENATILTDERGRQVYP